MMNKRTNNKVNVSIEWGDNIPLVDSLILGNTNNRTPKERAIATYVKEMLEGRWVLTNQGIGVSKCGVLIDGQNRLLAIRAAGYPRVPFLLVTGLSEDAGKYVDIGTKRSGADLLKMIFNITLAARVASLVSCSIKAKTGVWAVKHTPDELVEGYERINESVDKIYEVEGASKLSAPVTAALSDVLNETQDFRVMKFTEQLIRGEMLQSGDPALTLRNWLAGSSTRSTGGSLMQRDRYWRTHNAVMSFLKGKKLHKLYLREGQ